MTLPPGVEDALLDHWDGTPIAELQGALKLAEHGLIHYTTGGWKLTLKALRHLKEMETNQ